MARTLLAILFAATLAACATGGVAPATGEGPGSSTGAGTGGPNPGTTAGTNDNQALAARLTEISRDGNVCSLLTADVVQTVMPSAKPAEPGPYPGECGTDDGTGTIDLSVESVLGSVDPPTPAETVSGLGDVAYYQEQIVDDAYLVVVVGEDPKVEIILEYAGNDGRSHRDDAIRLAKAILAKAR
ncbi:MAG TPA: hypothetical protein VNL94_07430 [Candidatus Binatia bacterium]|nr:hypothetical protein [Candidatus Binatia bacterium]